jgi:hypothetical protein
MRALLLSSLVVLPLFFTNCDVKKPAGVVEASSLSDCSGSAPPHLRNPANIDQVITLINALPKPLSIDCFISSLQQPLATYAVNNAFSAQPSMGIDNPRIFIIRGSFLLSVVPAGPGTRLLEMSELISGSASVKGEIEFPVLQELAANAAYIKILSPQGDGTTCRGCHSGEVSYSGASFSSAIVRPDPAKKILLSYMKYQTGRCTDLNDSRCKMLRAIFQDSTVEGNFP